MSEITNIVKLSIYNRGFKALNLCNKIMFILFFLLIIYHINCSGCNDNSTTSGEKNDEVEDYTDNKRGVELKIDSEALLNEDDILEIKDSILGRSDLSTEATDDKYDISNIVQPEPTLPSSIISSFKLFEEGDTPLILVEASYANTTEIAQAVLMTEETSSENFLKYESSSSNILDGRLDLFVGYSYMLKLFFLIKDEEDKNINFYLIGSFGEEDSTKNLVINEDNASIDLGVLTRSYNNNEFPPTLKPKIETVENGYTIENVSDDDTLADDTSYFFTSRGINKILRDALSFDDNEFLLGFYITGADPENPKTMEEITSDDISKINNINKIEILTLYNNTISIQPFARFEQISFKNEGLTDNAAYFRITPPRSNSWELVNNILVKITSTENNINTILFQGIVITLVENLEGPEITKLELVAPQSEIDPPILIVYGSDFGLSKIYGHFYFKNTETNFEFENTAYRSWLNDKVEINLGDTAFYEGTIYKIWYKNLVNVSSNQMEFTFTTNP